MSSVRIDGSLQCCYSQTGALCLTLFHFVGTSAVVRTLKVLQMPVRGGKTSSEIYGNHEDETHSPSDLRSATAVNKPNSPEPMKRTRKGGGLAERESDEERHRRGTKRESWRSVVASSMSFLPPFFPLFCAACLALDVPLSCPLLPSPM